MDRSSDQFLPGSAPPIDQDRAIGQGDLADDSVDLLHLLALPDNVFKPVFPLQFPPQVDVLHHKAFLLDRLLHHD